MKANELMIGDWVIVNTYPEKVKLIGETLIKVWNRDNSIDVDDVSPIPLTAEILEKNGFIRFGTGYILERERFGLVNPSSPNNYLDNYWLRISIKAVHIEYVHELQHALRLCGIEKEIEL